MAHVSFLSKGINMNFSFICEQNAWSRLVHRVNKSLPSFKNTSLLKWEANKKKIPVLTDQIQPNTRADLNKTSGFTFGFYSGFTLGLLFENCIYSVFTLCSLGICFWGSILCTNSGKHALVLSYHLTVCTSRPLYIANRYVASAFRGLHVLVIGINSLYQLLVYIWFIRD